LTFVARSAPQAFLKQRGPLLNWIFFARMVAILGATVLHYAWPGDIPLIRQRSFSAPSPDAVPVLSQSIGVATYLMRFGSLPSGPGLLR
jgi:hypothetical protein